MKKKGKISSGFKFVLFILLCAFAGFVLGKVLAKNDVIILNLKKDRSMGSVVLRIFLTLCYIYIFTFLHIILHELGHLIFGLLSGYKFISFRIGSLTFIKENEKLKRKKFKIQGTGGQCLMMPPEMVNEKFPYKLYNFGGILMNFIVSIIPLICTFIFPVNLNIKIIVYIFSYLGFFIALVNGIPMKIGGVPNDGYNIFATNKDSLARKNFYLMLKVNGLLSEGIRYRDMPHEWFVLPEDADLNNTLNASLRIQEGNWYYDRMEFEKSKECYESLLDDSVKLIGLYEKELKCVLLFYEIVGECREEVINELYTKDLKRYINAMKCMIDKQKILYSYALFVEKDEKKAEKILNYAKKVQNTYPIKGEIITEMEMLNYVKNKYMNNINQG